MVPDPPGTGSDVPPARLAVVTGAGRGIGLRIAVGLAAAGCDVALLGRSTGGLQDAADQVRGHGRRALGVQADVTDAAAVQAAADRVERELGPVDLLVNNAGVIEAREVPAWEADAAEWRRVVEVDLVGPFHCVRAFVPPMVRRGAGRVVNLNSGAGAGDRAVYSAYCAAKAGLFRLSGNLHEAGFAAGLRAFEVAPGVVRSDMTAAMASHVGRTQWTGPQQVVDLVVAVASGSLDAFSGGFLRAGVDEPEALRAVAVGGLPPGARRLAVLPYGPDDPLA